LCIGERQAPCERLGFEPSFNRATQMRMHRASGLSRESCGPQLASATCPHLPSRFRCQRVIRMI
jgi:hypothetical protein